MRTQSTATTGDDELVAQLRRAVAAPGDPATLPATLEAQVGRKALVNTTTGYPLAGLRRVQIVPDPDHPTETLSLPRARAVVYWARDRAAGDTGDPKIVGVQVSDDGTASVFFGIVLPP